MGQRQPQPPLAHARQPGFDMIRPAQCGTAAGHWPAITRTLGVIGCTFLRLGYYLGMHISTGTVVGGKIVVEGLSLPEGTVVTVLTPEDDKIVKLAPELEKELIAAIDEADQEVGGAGPEFIESLKRYG